MKSLAVIFLSISLISIYSCSDTEEATADPVNIQNPYTENGIDSSVLQNMGQLSFADTAHDFGNIREGEVVEWDLDYHNIGEGNIVIQSAFATCGCTVPEYSREPLAPGDTASLKIKFDSAEKQGHVEKVVTIETNGHPATYHLKIRANVM